MIAALLLVGIFGLLGWGVYGVLTMESDSCWPDEACWQEQRKKREKPKTQTLWEHLTMPPEPLDTSTPISTPNPDLKNHSE